MEQTLKILIADENNEFRNKTKAALKQLGFTRFEEAVSGEDALQIINRFHPDVVLLDVWLSRMDCVQVIRSAEKMSFLPDNPPSYIVLSDAPNPNIYEEAIESGADYCMPSLWIMKIWLPASAESTGTSYATEGSRRQPKTGARTLKHRLQK